MVKIQMVEKISFKQLVIALIIFIAGGLLFLFSFQRREKEILNSSALDFTLQKKLISKINKAVSFYPKEGWGKTRTLLEEIMWECKKGSCNPEVFFNESLDSLANTLSNNQEFTYAGRTLGIIYLGNWELADVDDDQENEVVVIQRDALNINHTVLKIVDFQENSRVTSYKIEGVGYFSSPNSSGAGLAPIKILDLTGDTISEIALFLNQGRGGARLFVFQYQPSKLRLIFKKDNLSYPEYTFSDIDKDGILEISAEGYNPQTGKKIKEVLNL